VFKKCFPYKIVRVEKDETGRPGILHLVCNSAFLHKDMLTLGGATLVSSLLNLGLIDEVRLMVNPIILGGGKALFKDVKKRHALKLIRVKPLKSGKVGLTYSTRS